MWYIRTTLYDHCSVKKCCLLSEKKVYVTNISISRDISDCLKESGTVYIRVMTYRFSTNPYPKPCPYIQTAIAAVFGS